MAENLDIPSFGALVELLRDLFLDQADGIVELAGGTLRRLVVRRGEAYVDRDGPGCDGLAPMVAAQRGGGSTTAPVELVAELVRRLGGGAVGAALGRTPLSAGDELLGPLPTAELLVELAVSGRSRAELLEVLGGDGAAYRSAAGTPALVQLRRLDPEMAAVLPHLEPPVTPAELVRCTGGDGTAALRGLAKLRAVGLAAESRAVESAGEVLTASGLAALGKRIAEDLDGEPLELPAEEHRRQLSELLARLGELDHYRLLAVAAGATAEEIHTAYRRLARRVHPRHAAALGMEGREEALRVLFERATEAYLVLSDPRRRSSYNTLVGVAAGPTVDTAQRQEERREIAQRRYRRATDCVAAMEYSVAVDLLKEAARLDPRPEYLALLGRAQAKNPHWHRHACDSFRQAVGLAPGDAGIRVSFGDLLEEMGRLDEARREYEAALAAMPDNVKAQEGLERVSGRRAPVRNAAGGARGLFRRRQG